MQHDLTFEQVERLVRLEMTVQRGDLSRLQRVFEYEEGTAGLVCSVARGVAAPPVDGAATAVSISRTTAYRYFPNQAALLVAAQPETTITSLLAADAGDDPVERIRTAVATFVRLIIDTEPQQRTMLRLSLGDSPSELPLRKGRAIAWFEDALEPLRTELGKGACVGWLSRSAARSGSKRWCGSPTLPG